MASQNGGSFRLNVLSPGGRDPEQHFGAMANDSPGSHAPVNYHAYAACTGGSFFRDTARAIQAGDPVLLLLRGDFRDSERALFALKKAKVPTAVTLKETGLQQIAKHLRDRGKLSRFLKIVDEADGCIAPTAEAAELYRMVRRHEKGVMFIPTPYPTHDPRWNFARSFHERRGIFVGTREWDVPSRNHVAALLAARQISELTGQRIAVYDFAGRTGARLLAEMGMDEAKLEVRTKRVPYVDYLRVLAGHKIVFQLDSSFVPGQVAGDALLCRIPCIGGNGAVDRLGFPDLCGSDRSLGELIDLVIELLQDAKAYENAVASSQERATEHLSFSSVSDQLARFFATLG
ncbi:MAG: hypothetical protein H0W04_06350 [Chthoniobacterales bacterium]|nr:hypothetical protein [Chthoniobacterales bacterium]